MDVYYLLYGQRMTICNYVFCVQYLVAVFFLIHSNKAMSYGSDIESNLVTPPYSVSNWCRTQRRRLVAAPLTLGPGNCGNNPQAPPSFAL